MGWEGCLLWVPIRCLFNKKKQARADICVDLIFLKDILIIGQSESEEAERKVGERERHDMQQRSPAGVEPATLLLNVVRCNHY